MTAVVAKIASAIRRSHPGSSQWADYGSPLEKLSEEKGKGTRCIGGYFEGKRQRFFDCDF